MKKNSQNSETTHVCAVDFAFKRIGGKYKARILWHLHTKSVLRYGELLRTLPDITTKMLTQTLRELEADRLVIRKTYNEVPPRVEYSLTDAATELIGFIELMHSWGRKHMTAEEIGEQDAFYQCDVDIVPQKKAALVG